MPATPPALPPQPEQQRRGAGWLWAIPLALLLLAGGCYLAQQNRAATGSAASGAAGAGMLAVTDPAAGTRLPAAAFTMRGTGTAGQTLTILDGGNQLGTSSVGTDGTWSFEVPAPGEGAHNYQVKGPDAAAAPAQLAVTVGAAGSADSGTTNAVTTGAAAGALSISSPANGSSVPAGAFDLSGAGTAGQEVEVFEDGSSIGKVSVSAEGTWTLNVPSPSPGAHTYQVKGQGQAVSSTLTVQAPSADASAASCSQDFSASLKDGQSVTAPFRFGGQGSGSRYRITVLRGSRVVGSRTVRLGAACGWSYRSNPGQGELTYVVRPGQDASAAPVLTLTLNVQ